MSDRMLTISASPHVHSSETTPKMMLWVCACLVPSCLWGVYSFGYRAFLVLAVSVASCEVFEYAFSKALFGKSSLSDFSALVTGLLIGMNLSAAVPLYVPVAASFFAIAVAKMTFGGLGQNFMNPALAGRVFVFFSFTAAMSVFPQHRIWKDPSGYVFPAPTERFSAVSDAGDGASSDVSAASAFRPSGDVDAITSASPLASYKSNPLSGSLSNLEYMECIGHPYSRIAANVSRRIGINPYVIDAFLGFKNGCIGEISALLLILGAIALIIKKLISYVIPVFYIGIYMLLEWVFGGLVYGNGLFAGEALYSVLTGGILLCALFMATDMVTSPVTKQGHMLYASLLALMTFLIRRFSSLPEGVSIALLLGNIAVPTIDKHFRRRVYGVAK